MVPREGATQGRASWNRLWGVERFYNFLWCLILSLNSLTLSWIRPVSLTKEQQSSPRKRQVSSVVKRSRALLFCRATEANELIYFSSDETKDSTTCSISSLRFGIACSRNRPRSRGLQPLCPGLPLCWSSSGGGHNSLCFPVGMFHLGVYYLFYLFFFEDC